jgi:riboflavin kinase / FMN adenylyltransferase
VTSNTPATCHPVVVLTVKEQYEVQVWRRLDQVDPGLDKSVVTVGNFDGVHLGHRHVLSRAHEIAASLGDLPVVVISFDPHPMVVLRPDRAPAMLTTMDQRARLLEAAGADVLLVLRFDKEMAQWSPEEFVRRILVDTLHAEVVVVGENFRFGHRAAGTVDLLRELGETYGFRCETIALDGSGRPWSSTLVRERVADGDVAAAAAALGRAYTVEGTVARGERRGQQLGYPTANVPTDDLTAVPVDGVYTGWLQRLDAPAAPRLPAAISIGSNPTFDGTRRVVEAYVLDRTDLELYDVTVRIGFIERLRDMERFDSIDDLLVAMRRDVDQTRDMMATLDEDRP